MTRALAARMWPLMKAYAEGAQILTCGVFGWRTELDPSFIGDPDLYRAVDADAYNEELNQWWQQQNQDDDFINDAGNEEWT